MENLKNLWYSITGGGSNGMKGLVDAKELGVYISEYYEEKFNKPISPLKLQKALYFCFGYWGGFIRKSKGHSKKEIDLNYSEYLFDNTIEAWVYGPVIPDVYNVDKAKELSNYKNSNLFNGMDYVQEFINGILDDVLPVNDFKLVEISHEDKCWKKHFNKNNIFHNAEIPKEEIIREYAKNS